MSTKSEHLQWRRSKVIEMRSEGLSQIEIARELQVSEASISLDMQYLRTFEDKGHGFTKYSNLVKALKRSRQQSRLSEILKDKPFWIWNTQEHIQEDINTKGNCCFNHIIGLATKEGVEKAMFDYEKILYDSILVNDVSN